MFKFFTAICIFASLLGSESKADRFDIVRVVSPHDINITYIPGKVVGGSVNLIISNELPKTICSSISSYNAGTMLGSLSYTIIHAKTMGKMVVIENSSNVQDCRNTIRISDLDISNVIKK
jgi:hypothetical protein